MTNDPRLRRWHDAVMTGDPERLLSLLADDVEFHSPVVWTPKRGREVTHFVLRSVAQIFQDFRYEREWIDGNDFALEFAARVDELEVKGIDLIRWNDAGRIVHFEVMLRPASSVMRVGERMTERFREAGLLPAG